MSLRQIGGLYIIAVEIPIVGSSSSLARALIEARKFIPFVKMDPFKLIVYVETNIVINDVKTYVVS